MAGQLRDRGWRFAVIGAFWITTFPALALGCGDTGSAISDVPKTGGPPPQPLSALDSARLDLRRYIEMVAQAEAHRYGATDNARYTLDCLKIIQSSAVGGFIGVYHTFDGSKFDVHLATSTDLLTWRWIRRLGTSASQPTIAPTDSGFVVVWEQEPQNHLRFTYYRNWSDLEAGTPLKTLDAPQTLSPCAEGTPNIYAASATAVDAGFHYFAECDVDRQARGTTDWSSWKSTPQPALDSAVLAHGIRGNVGDRDGPIRFRGFDFSLIEGQRVKGDFGSWRVFLYDHQTGAAEPLNIVTHAGSTAFGNPTIASIDFRGRRALVITLFLFGEGAGLREGGPLIYYRYF